MVWGAPDPWDLASRFHHGMLHMTGDIKITGRDRVKDRHATDVAHGVGIGGQLGAFHEDRPDLWGFIKGDHHNYKRLGP